MRLHVIARGKIGRSPEQELCDRYARRITWPLNQTELPERGGTIPPPLTPVREVLLDERGKQLSSEEFAALLGSWRDGGWAPVLQSALANNALESADEVGRTVNKDVMKKSRDYQNGNFDTKTNAAVTEDVYKRQVARYRFVPSASGR